MAEQKFDPRFDPAFQRGYDPDEHGSESGGAPAGAPGGADSADGAATASGETRDQHRPEESVPPVGDAATAASGGSEQGQAQPVQPNPTEPNPAQPNPFERTLGVIGAALVILGVGAVLWANNANYNGPGETWGWHQALQSLAWVLSSPMITIGLATGVGLVFRRAIAWGPRE
jgi:hypothetical protein